MGRPLLPSDCEDWTSWGPMLRGMMVGWSVGVGERAVLGTLIWWPVLDGIVLRSWNWIGWNWIGLEWDRLPGCAGILGVGVHGGLDD